jgi:cell division protease FtsH
VTIVPHGQALGVAFSLPEDDVHAHSRSWLVDRITIAFGGYAAEQVKFQEVTTGAQNDIEQATNLSRRMVCEWGMSDKLGPVTYGQKEEPIFLGKEIARHREYSEDTAEVIDGEIKGLINGCLEKARAILSEHEDQLDLLAETLIERETLDDGEIRKLLGFPPAKKDSGDGTESTRESTSTD